MTRSTNGRASQARRRAQKLAQVASVCWPGFFISVERVVREVSRVPASRRARTLADHLLQSGAPCLEKTGERCCRL